MDFVITIALGLVVGYSIPILTALAFAMVSGSAAPEFVAREGRLRVANLNLFGLLWTLSSVVAGYMTALIAGVLPWAVCGGLGVLLSVVLWSNREEMMKQQSWLRLSAMTLATFAGLALGVAVYGIVEKATAVAEKAS